MNYDLYFLHMKQLLLLITILCFGSQAGLSQDTDSLLLENTQYIKKRINLLLYRINEMEQKTSGQLDSLQNISASSIKKMGRLETQASQQHHSLKDTIENRSNQLQACQNNIRQQIKRTSTLHFILSGLFIAMIVLLLLLYLRERRRSIDYLIRRTERIAGQNDQILEKAGELKDLRVDLEKNIKQQKKLRKKIKKKKK